jgi:DNA anti-recombination protein RmuC
LAMRQRNQTYETVMKRILTLFFANAFIIPCLLLTSCNSSTEKDRKELANAEEEALDKAAEANKLVPQEADTKEIEGVKKDLEKASEKLSEKQEKYLASLKQQERRINDRLKAITEKLQSADDNSKKNLTEKLDKLTKERDQLQANILEIQSPMTDQQLETVQKEINLLIAIIDRELDS